MILVLLISLLFASSIVSANLARGRHCFDTKDIEYAYKNRATGADPEEDTVCTAIYLPSYAFYPNREGDDIHIQVSTTFPDWPNAGNCTVHDLVTTWLEFIDESHGVFEVCSRVISRDLTCGGGDPPPLPFLCVDWIATQWNCQYDSGFCLVSNSDVGVTCKDIYFNKYRFPVDYLEPHDGRPNVQCSTSQRMDTASYADAESPSACWVKSVRSDSDYWTGFTACVVNLPAEYNMECDHDTNRDIIIEWTAFDSDSFSGNYELTTELCLAAMDEEASLQSSGSYTGLAWGEKLFKFPYPNTKIAAYGCKDDSEENRGPLCMQVNFASSDYYPEGYVPEYEADHGYFHDPGFSTSPIVVCTPTYAGLMPYPNNPVQCWVETITPKAMLLCVQLSACPENGGVPSEVAVGWVAVEQNPEDYCPNYVETRLSNLAVGTTSAISGVLVSAVAFLFFLRKKKSYERIPTAIE